MTYTLTATAREKGTDLEALRDGGAVPAVLYGPEIEAQSITLKTREFELLYNEAGESSLINLTIGDQKEPTIVLIQDAQYDPVSGNLIHVDLRQIKMGEEMHASIELTYVGEAPAVKALGGTLLKSLDYINVTCLPKDLVNHIDVDLSSLVDFDTAIHISDLAIPAGMTVTDETDTVVAKVAAPLTEDQIKAMEEAGPGSVEDIEDAEEKKKDEDAEGEAAADDKKEE